MYVIRGGIFYTDSRLTSNNLIPMIISCSVNGMEMHREHSRPFINCNKFDTSVFRFQIPRKSQKFHSRKCHRIISRTPVRRIMILWPSNTHSTISYCAETAFLHWNRRLCLGLWIVWNWLYHIHAYLVVVALEWSMMTSSNGDIFCVTGPLCGEFTGPRWIPHAKASDAELWYFLWSLPE